MQSLSPDYYERLGIKRYSSVDDVRAAFRALAMQHHPDKSGNEPEQEDYFKQLSEAYHTLSDEERKRQYDVYISGYYQWVRKASAAATPEPVRRTRTREDLNREIEEDFSKFTKFLPLKWRYLIGTGVAILGIQVLYRQLLYPGNFQALWLLIAMFMVVLGWLFVINAYFKRVNIAQLRTDRNLGPERRTGLLYLGLILGSFLLAWGSMEGSKSWQLSKYPGYSPAKIVMLEGRDGFPVPGVRYTDGKRWFYKQISEGEALRLVDLPNITVRFSRIHPEIAKVEE